MSAALELLRPEISRLKPYKPADYVGGFIRLNANETPWRPPGDDSRDGLNRYPDPRPAELTARLAAHYGVAADALLVTRGSSEAIDLLVRGFCRAGQDEIVICPPTFGMYEFYAQVQGAGIRRIPLDRDSGYTLPVDEICAQWTAQSKLVFVCSPNNPTGNCFPDREVERLATALAGRGVVVLDSAYVEFAASDPLQAMLDSPRQRRGAAHPVEVAEPGRHPLRFAARPASPHRTARTGTATLLLSDQQPGRRDALPRRRSAGRTGGPSADHHRGAGASWQKPSPNCRMCCGYGPATANFLLVETTPGSTLSARARAGNILLRDFGWDPMLPNCVRITVGSPADNQQLLKALRS